MGLIRVPGPDFSICHTSFEAKFKELCCCDLGPGALGDTLVNKGLWPLRCMVYHV